MKKALVVIDYQNDFVSGSLGFPRAVEIEDAICSKIQACRENGYDILFTMDTHSKDYLQTQEGKKLPVEHCIKGTDGWNLYGKVAALRMPEDKVFEKGAFGSTEISHYGFRSQYDEVELIGVVTNICVISNAILLKAAMPEAIIKVDASCTASNDATLHEKALDVMESLQVEIINRD